MKHDLVNYDKYKKHEVDIGNFANQFAMRGPSFAHRFEFENGYGASIIKHFGSYGYEEDLFELAVLHKGILTYGTPITSNVIGYMTNEDVLKTLEKIKKLKEV